MNIRAETPEDIFAIRSVTDAAFKGVEHSSQTEGAIVEALRRADALAVSLIAEQNGAIIGHVAFTSVLIDGRDVGWFGLGPVSVCPGFQRSGIGSALIEEGLKQIRGRGANGCVVVGDPNYYRRFGFANNDALRYAGAPAEYFQTMRMQDEPPKGEVTYHAGFEAQ